MDWSYFLAAFGLYLVFEGLLPFAFPAAFKRVQAQLQALPEGQLRWMGAVSIGLGLLVLTLA